MSVTESICDITTGAGRKERKDFRPFYFIHHFWRTTHSEISAKIRIATRNCNTEEIRDKERMYQSGTAEASFPDSMRPQGLMAFRDILDIVLHLCDEEWMSLTKDMTHQFTKLKFASLCTKIVISVSASVIAKMLPDLIESFGIESVLRAEAKLKKKVECESRSHSATSGSSGQRLPEDSSDLVCNSVETAITKIKAAMQEAIRRVASGQKSKTVAEDVNKSLTNISPDSDVKPETDGSAQLQNKATEPLSAILVKKVSHILTQTGLDPNVVTSSDAKDIVGIVVNGLVSAAEENDVHAFPSGTSSSSKKPCSGLQDAAPAVPDAQKKPSKLLADVDSCTEEVMCQLEKLYVHEEQQAKSSFYKKPQSKGKMYIVSNAEMTSEESSFVTSRSDVFLNDAALAVRNILLEKSVPDLLDKPITTLYDSGPFRSQFALKRGAMDSGGSAVMILDQFYESMQSIAADATNSSDALAGFAGDAVDIGKGQSWKSPRTTLKKVRGHLQEFLSKFSPEEIKEKEDELVIDLCTEEVINEAVYLYRNELTGPTSITEINILTSAQFQAKLAHRVSEIILQKLESCPSLMPKKCFSEGHLKDISSDISRSVSSTLQQFASSQLALRSDSSSQTSPSPLLRAPNHSGHSSLFSPLCLFIEVQNKLKNFFSLFIESPEKPDRSAESEKDDADDDRVIPIYITDDGSVHEITDENELLFKREYLAPQDMIREQAHVLTTLTAELFLKSNEAGSFGRKLSSDSLLETAGTEVNTVNFIPRPSELVYTFAEESIKCLLHYVLKPSPERSHLAGSNQGASCSTPEVISGSGAAHEAEKNIMDRSAGRPSPESLGNLTINNQQNPPSCCSLLPISHGGSVDPASVAIEKEERRGFDIILEKIPPMICCGFKKLNNGSADFLTLSEQPTSSTEEDLHMSSHGELNSSRHFLKNFRKSLARMFSCISRACTSCVRDQSTL